MPVKAGLHFPKRQKRPRSGRESIEEGNEQVLSSQNKSERSVIDSHATIGLGCTREAERVLASFGKLSEPAELGKVIGLDRIPEVKTLRRKVEWISQQGKVGEWSRELGKSWLEDGPDLAGILYIDGHVRVYNGKKTKLPKRFVSRQKLCLRGVTDYWINDALGQPFFVVTQSVNNGLISVLREEIVPELLKDVPNQPSEDELKENQKLYRFGIVFDREGYSPAFFKEMWDEHIACYTYRKYAK